MICPKRILFLIAFLVPLAAHSATAPTFTTGPSGVVSDPSIQPIIGGPSNSNLSLVSYIAPIDLLGNGRQDLVVGIGMVPQIPQQTQPIRVLASSGNGTFTDSTKARFGSSGPLPSAVSPRVLYAADFNRDGKPDIFCACQGLDGLPFAGEVNVLLESQPSGGFANLTSKLPTSADFTHSAAIADINGDGLLDIFVGNIWNATQVGPYLLLGKPDGTFQQVKTGLPDWLLNLTQRFTYSLLIDVDNDGFPDLVLGTDGQFAPRSSVVLFNDGTGDFTKRTPYTLPAGAFGANSIVTFMTSFDANGDGYPDILVISTQAQPAYTGGAVQLLINQRDGTFLDQTAARLGARATQSTGVAWNGLQVVDLNADGLPDIVGIADYGSNAPSTLPYVWLNNGDGSFSPAGADTVTPPLSGRLVAVDANGDGIPDLVTLNFFGDGSLHYQTYLNSTPKSFPVRHSGVDLGGNGRSVITARSPTGMMAGVFNLNDPISGNLFQWSSIADPGNAFSATAVADLNGNAKSDFIYQTNAVDSTGKVTVSVWPDFSSNGATALRTVKPAWIVQATGDLDGDGKGDLVFRFTGDDGIPNDTGVSYIWFTDGANVTQVRKRGGAPLSWTLLGAADLNGDGAADMIYASPANQLRALMATPNRTCANLSAGTIPAGFSAVKMADFTGLGRADILVRNNSTGAVGLQSLNARGIGLPAFTGAPDDPNASCTSSSLSVSSVFRGLLAATDPTWAFYAAGDFNGDGITDIVWKKPDGTLVLWLMNSTSSMPTIVFNAGTAPTGTIVSP